MLWFKALHLITMVTWFAGIFYLPRLFVYHAEISADDAKGHERFCIMERRLYRGILLPSSLLTLLFGGALAYYYGLSPLMKMGWFHLKLTCVLLLIGYQHYCARCMKKLANKTNSHSPLFYRVFNELPVILLVCIIFAAVMKPF